MLKLCNLRIDIVETFVYEVKSLFQITSISRGIPTNTLSTGRKVAQTPHKKYMSRPSTLRQSDETLTRATTNKN
jgi:hypothetical protein